MGLYTCISCRVAFATPDLQKAHHKTDWHRYNLKRKVAELPPVTAVDFQQRVLERRAQIAEEDKKQDAYCQLCKKQFSTEKAFQNHEQSKKHQEAASKIVEKNNRKNLAMNATGATDNLSQNELAKNFANLKTKNLENNNRLEKEQKTGKKMLPPKPSTSKQKDVEADDDSDSDSWEEVSDEALSIEECLFCSNVSKSLEKNMKHMTVEHSFFVPDAEYLVDLEGLITYLGEKVGEGNMCLWCGERGKAFFSSKAAQQHMIDKGHCKMWHEGDALLEYEDFYDYRSSYPDYNEKSAGKEDDDDDEEDVDIEQLVVDGYELVLPSGATVGHRSLKLYYRQNLPQRTLGRTSTALPRVLAQYKALGWTGTTTVAAKKKAKDISYMHQLRSRRDLHLGMKANKFQPHFRPQVIF